MARGIIVAPRGESVDPHKEMVLNTGKNQFKFEKVVDLTATFPAVSAGEGGSVNDIKSIYMSYRYENDLTFPVAVRAFVRGLGDRWGIPIPLSPQSLQQSDPDFPYVFRTFVSLKSLIGVRLYISNPFLADAYPEHEVTLRLIISTDRVLEQ